MISERNILEYVSSQRVLSGSCDHSDFFEWQNGTKSLISSLKSIGKIQLKATYEQKGPYWGLNAPIVLDGYPYNRSEILQCQKCGLCFFNYQEVGGHGIQNRYRVIRPALFLNRCEEIIIDLARVTNSFTIHEYFKKELGFPSFYGKNWDAFWDVITGLVVMPELLILFNWDEYSRRFQRDAGILLELSEKYNNREHGDQKIRIVGDSRVF